MKTKRLVAAVVGTAVVAASAFAFAGCGGGPGKAELNISDYAVDFGASYGARYNRGYSALEEALSFSEDNVVSSNGDYIVLRESGANETYSVFSLVTGTYVRRNLIDVPTFQNFGNYGYAIRLTDGGSVGSYTFVAEDGTVLLTGVAYSFSYSTQNVYIGNDSETTRVLAVSGTAQVNGQTVTNYFTFEEDEETGVYSFTAVNASDVKFYSSQFGKDEINNGLTRRIYESTKERPVEGEIAEYEYKAVGNKCTFYKDGQQTGELDTTNVVESWFVGDYMYYVKEEIIDSNATSGYNFLQQSQYCQIKTKESLYKYDIIKNRNTEVNYNAAVRDIDVLYNHETKAYDAAVVNGYKMVDGVATYPLNEFTYVTDSNLDVAYDISGYSVGGIYKLSDYLFYTGNYFIDDGFIVLGAVNSSDIKYVSETDVLVAYSVNNRYGFKDSFGRIVAEPKYTRYNNQADLNFYGGYALLNELQSDGTSAPVLLSSNGLSAKINLQDNDVLTVGSGYYIIREENSIPDGYNSYDYTVYNFNGLLLRRFSGVGANAVSINNNYVSVLGDDGVITLYKFV